MEDQPDYYEYLKSDYWQRVRQAVTERSGGVCERCKHGPVQDIHHVNYDYAYRELDNLDCLLALCYRCHCEIHNVFYQYNADDLEDFLK